MRTLASQVVVITGASSGIGRESALRFGRAGASVVLAARNAEALRDVAAEIERIGGRALAVPADVGDWDAVEALARATVEHFGRIDTWVNGAGVTEYAEAERMRIEEIDRIVRVNLLGQIYGCKAAIPHLRAAGGGTIINIASVLAVRAVPLQSIYCASKHGVRGFTESLRMELKHDNSGIEVCVVLPSSINTPFFDHARSHMDQQPAPIPPVYEPSAVANVILHLAERPRREVVVGGAGKLLAVLQKLSPSLVDWYMVRNARMWRQQLSGEADDGIDNLFAPQQRPATTGEFDGVTRASSVYTEQVELHPMRSALAAGVFVSALVLLGRRAAR